MKNGKKTVLLAAAGRLIVMLLLVLYITGRGGHTSDETTPFIDEPYRMMIVTDIHYLSPALTDNGSFFTELLKRGNGKTTMYSTVHSSAMKQQRSIRDRSMCGREKTRRRISPPDPKAISNPYPAVRLWRPLHKRTTIPWEPFLMRLLLPTPLSISITATFPAERTCCRNPYPAATLATISTKTASCISIYRSY